MLTQAQINQTKDALQTTWSCRKFQDDDIKGMAPTIDDFAKEFGADHEVKTAANGLVIHVWPKLTECRKGHFKTDLTVIDFGTERAGTFIEII